MKQKIKKLFCVLILSSLLINNSYAIVWSTYDYNNTKIKKLERLNIQLNDYINKNLKKEIITIKNYDAKQGFNNELSLVNEIHKDIVNHLEYADDTQYNESLAKIKSQARSYTNIKRDLNNYVNNWINIFKIETSETTNIENNIINVQTYYTDILKKSLEWIDFQKDVKQTWDWKFEISSNMWKITFSIDKYTSIFSILTGNQEADYDIAIWFDIKKDETLNIPFDIIGNVNFKINAKIIDKEVYFTLNDYLFNFDWIKDASIQQMITTYKTMLEPYKWKTIHIPAETSSGQLKFDSASQLSNLKSAIDLLTKKSLLTPYKKNWDWFLLAPNKETVSALVKIYWWEFTEEQYMEMKKTLNNYPLLYVDNNWSAKITSSVNDKWNQYNLTIEKKWVDYSIELSSKKTTYWKEVQLYLYLQKDNYKFDVISKEATFQFSLVNKIFDMLFDMPKFNMTIKWNSDNESCDLKMTINSQEIWTIKSSKDSKGNYTYDIRLKIADFSKIYPEISSEFKDKFLEINIVWKYLIEKWEFKIEKPASFIELEDITWAKSDLSNSSSETEEEVDFSKIQ